MKNYEKTAKQIRKTVLEMLFKAQTSHIGSNFSCVDLLTVLYDKADFKKDKLVVSKGWVAATIYALGVKHGLMPKEAIETYCDGKSKYIGLVEPLGYWGCEFAGGSMGYGLPAGVGYALGKKLRGEKGTVYVLMSDGEQAIGTTWEAAALASHHGLDNLVVIVDRNGHQAMGKTETVLDMDCLGSKWDAFNFDVIDVDGHDFKQIETALDYCEGVEQPKVIIAKTTKGKGVSIFEDNNLYHYKQLDEKEYGQACKELR